MNKEILDFNLCKRLYEAGVRVDTEKERHGKPFPQNEYFDEPSSKEGSRLSYWSPLPDIPALTIVDGLELIGEEINIWKCNGEWDIELIDANIYFKGTLKECIEKSLTYLLDNGHIGKS